MKIRKKDVDDVHFFDNSFKRAVELFKETTDRAANVELMNKFIASCR
ncbi:site-specific integrase, partial [Methanosalsum natronophilum]